MLSRLEAVSRSGDISGLYTLLNEDLFLLDRFDGVPFAETPLHTASREGNDRFGSEIMTLKPSLSRKLNPEGFSPVHVALQNGKIVTAMRLVEIDRDLVRVRGREAKTPLHLAAEIGAVDAVAMFLSVCPDSIGDLTVCKETAAHIAVKNGGFEALRVLVGWLDHVGRDEVLNMADDEGNTVLHLATATNQTEMVRLFINRVDINAKNLAGLTSLDVLESQRPLTNEKLRRILLRSGALRGSSLLSVPTLADTLKTKMTWRERCLISDRRRNLGTSTEDRNIMLVVAVLFATANYQAWLSSPDMYSNIYSLLFGLINNVAFLASICEIYLYLPKGRFILRLVLVLVMAYVLIMSYDVWVFVIKLCIVFVLYHSKLLAFLHKLVPLSEGKKSLEVRYSVLKSYYRDFSDMRRLDL